MIRYDMINIPIANIGGRPESPPHTRAHLQTDSLREKKTSLQIENSIGLIHLFPSFREVGQTKLTLYQHPSYWPGVRRVDL